MCPLSDDALLEWALSPQDADPDIELHLQECDACRQRSQAVVREQEYFRSALAPPEVPSAPVRSVPRSEVWPRLGIAALLLVSLTFGVLLARSAGSSPSGRGRPGMKVRHAALEPIQEDLGIMAQKIAAARETLPEREDQTVATAYLELLNQEESLYLSGMEQYLSEISTLSEAQRQELRRIVREVYATQLGRGDFGTTARAFREQIHGLLNDEQYRAFEEFSRQGAEWQWKTAIALLTNDLSGELDLRFSEAERVRHALESNYPRADLPVLPVDCCPSDLLVDNPTLTGAVRNSLDATYQRKFDSFLGHVRVARERALKIVRRQKAD